MVVWAVHSERVEARRRAAAAVAGNLLAEGEVGSPAAVEDILVVVVVDSLAAAVDMGSRVAAVGMESLLEEGTGLAGAVGSIGLEEELVHMVLVLDHIPGAGVADSSRLVGRRRAAEEEHSPAGEGTGSRPEEEAVLGKEDSHPAGVVRPVVDSTQTFVRRRGRLEVPRVM
jgi:hypothetical protein